MVTKRGNRVSFKAGLKSRQGKEEVGRKGLTEATPHLEKDGEDLCAHKPRPLAGFVRQPRRQSPQRLSLGRTSVTERRRARREAQHHLAGTLPGGGDSWGGCNSVIGDKPRPLCQPDAKQRTTTPLTNRKGERGRETGRGGDPPTTEMKAGAAPAWKRAAKAAVCGAREEAAWALQARATNTCEARKRMDEATPTGLKV